jgi:hypothetical protein
MKVKTNLKSGNVLNDAVQVVNYGANQVSGFFSAADQQAKGLVKSAKNTLASSWNWVSSRWPF